MTYVDEAVLLVERAAAVGVIPTRAFARGFHQCQSDAGRYMLDRQLTWAGRTTRVLALGAALGRGGPLHNATLKWCRNGESAKA